MSELINNAFGPQNLTYTIFLIVILFYWLTVIIGVFDVNSFDVDVDIDVDIDVDVDVDVDMDTDVDTPGGANPFFKLLSFFNVGKVPFMIFLSFLILSLWVGGMMANKYFGANSITGTSYLGLPKFAFGTIVFTVNLFIGIFVTKLITQPMRGLFKESTSEFETRDDIIGKVCEIIVKTTDSAVGQAELKGENEAPILLLVKAHEGNSLKKGDRALITSYDEEEEVYYVDHFDH